MRFRHRDGSVVHLSYCTNMHPAEDLDGIIEQLHSYAAAVRATLDWPLLGVGLWLSAPVAAQLANSHVDLQRLKTTLAGLQLETVTLNGFPYKSFQAEKVKYDVFHPDWSTRERLTYTLQLAQILHELLPEDAVEGSISTLPLGWRTEDLSTAPALLQEAATGLAELADKYGRPVRLSIEPEPGCLVGDMQHGVTVVGDIAPEWIGMCLDACHLAVQFENAADAIAQSAAAGVAIVKAQISNALRVPDPNDRGWLSDFMEPRFMHQARQQTPDGLLEVDDLDEFSGETLNGTGEWRVHFHVPLDGGGDRTTQSELRDTLQALVGGDVPVTHHLEVETYMWSVLPEAQRPTDVDGLVKGIANELQWTADQLISLGLEPIT